MRLSAIDSLQHGLLNLRANWQLIVLQVVQNLLVAVISLVGLVPIFMVLGFTFVRGAFENFGSGGEAELLARLFAAGLPLVAAFLVTTLIWTVAFIVYCYMQGGILGVLAGGERRALGLGVTWQNFREFSMPAFFRQAERLTWPVFWLVNLFLVIGTVVITVFFVIGVLLVMAMVGNDFSTGAGLESLGEFGVGLLLFGCLGFVLVLCFSLFFTVWMQVSLAELVAGTGGVLAAARAGLGIVGRRLPGLALLVLLLLVASVALAIGFTPLSLVMDAFLGDRLMTYLVAQACLTILQWAATGVITLGWAGTIIALVIGERGGDAGDVG